MAANSGFLKLLYFLAGRGWLDAYKNKLYNKGMQ